MTELTLLTNPEPRSGRPPRGRLPRALRERVRRLGARLRGEPRPLRAAPPSPQGSQDPIRSLIDPRDIYLA